MATYVNDLRLKEIATGDESGTWGTSTNTNLELIAEAFSFGTEAITTNADTHTTTIADGSTDPGRSIYLKYTGTLDSACTITIGPNTVSKLWFIENGTSGSQNIIISQGSGANVTIPPGDVKAVYSDGAGSGAAIVDAFASLNVVDLKVEDDLTVTDDASVGGDLLVSGEVQTANIGFTDGDNAITISDGGGTSFAQALTANAGVVIDNITIDGTEIDLSSGDLTLDVAGDIILDAAGDNWLFNKSGTTLLNIQKDSDNLEFISSISDGDMKFRGNDGGSTITALTLDMSDAGTAVFNNRVGIGVSSPTGKLEIAATGTNAAPHIKLVEDSDTREFNIYNDGSGNGHLVLADSDDDTPDTEIVLNDNGIITMLTANTERMRIASGGSVSLGTTTSTAPFNVQADGSARGIRILGRDNGTSDEAALTFADNANNTTVDIITVGNALTFFQGGSETLRLDANGKLLVGNSSSGGSGEVQADVGFDAQDGSNTTSIAIRNYSSSTNSGQIMVDPDGNGANSVLYVNVDGVTPSKLKLDSAGRLNIDQVDTRFGTGALNITGEVGASFAAIQFRHNASTVVGSVVTGASSTTYNTSSDYRLKENVDYNWDATTRLKQLKPARFNWISDETNTLVDGFLAHEVQDIVPAAITGEKDAMMDEKYEITPAVVGADGSIVTEAVMGTHSVPDYQNIDHSKLVPLLVKTIQELEARITALES